MSAKRPLDTQTHSVQWMRHAAILSASLALTGCQSWETFSVSVSGADPEKVRSSVVALASAQGLRTCAEWKVTVSGADVCFGGRVSDSGVTVAGFRQADSYVVKVGFYTSGSPRPSEWSELHLQYRAAIAAAAPAAKVELQQTRELLQVQSL
jgi:hypothetical protein